MKRHLLIFLIGASVMVIAQTSRAQSIVAVHDESGRTVFVNNYDAAQSQPPSSSASAKTVTGLAYWSRKESRWVPVTASAAAMLAARKAAREVTNFVATAPRSAKVRVASGPIA